MRVFFGTLILIGALAGFVGWLINIAKVITMAFHGAPLNAEFAIRIIGIPIAFVGAILGFMTE